MNKYKIEDCENFVNQSNEAFRRRAKDCEKVAKVQKIIDELLKSSDFSFQRTEDATLQKRGVDLFLMREKENGMFESRAVDEKYAISCWNRNLETFSFELSSKNNVNGNGWFINPYMYTDDYLLVWLRADDENLDSIYKVEIAIVKKNAIHSWLRSSNVSLENILEDFQQKALLDVKTNRKIWNVTSGVKVIQSLKFSEKPINILCDKNTLLKLSYFTQKWEIKKQQSA